MNVLAYSPDNLGFASFNAGAASFIPSGATDASFLVGVHISGVDMATDIMPDFVNEAVTTNSLAAPELGPGTYCFLIQQTSQIVQSYSLEFVIEEEGVQTESSTWGKIRGSLPRA